MISLQRSMHSSQMYTPGPAISFLTCFWLFPQNEHLSRSPPSPMRAMSADPESHLTLPRPECPGGAYLVTVPVEHPRRELEVPRFRRCRRAVGAGPRWPGTGRRCYRTADSFRL